MGIQNLPEIYRSRRSRGPGPILPELAEGSRARDLMGPCPRTIQKLPSHLWMSTVGSNDSDDDFAGRISGKLAISENKSSQQNTMMGLF